MIEKSRSRLVARRGLVLRACLLFFGTYGSLMAVVFFVAPGPIERACSLWTARTAAWALWLLGADGRAEGMLVVSSLSSFRVIPECTPLYPGIIFVSAVMASPTRWPRRFLGVALGVPALVLINLVRLVSLSYIEHFFPEAAQTAHLVVWQGLMIFFTVLLWIFWAARFLLRDESRLT